MFVTLLATAHAALLTLAPFPPRYLQKMVIVKFRERWEKLKESAKRKKEAKAAGVGEGSASHGIGPKDRIVEEPEAEEALDGTTG